MDKELELLSVSMNDKSDEELITAALEGDSGAFRMLVERHEGKVAGIVKSILGDCPEAADVGQEVFIRFYQSMDRFKRESSLATYLVRIAINLALNELKKRKRKSGLFHPLESAQQVSNTESADEEAMQVLRKEIALLDPEFNAVVSLRLIEGYSTEETAEILKVPVGTVLSRLFRAQKKLKDVFLKHRKYE